jgi:hypothetical protein
MSHLYGAFCEDFYINMRLGSQLHLPHGRDTVLGFYERIQKQFPQLTRFRKQENGEYNLEEERGGQGYRWVTLESKRLSTGHVNPASLEEGLRLHAAVLEITPYHLGISPVEVDYLDVLFGFDLEFVGNHDEVIADSLFGESPLSCLTEEQGARPVDFQPSVTVALSEDCRLQARIDVVTRTNSYQIRTGDYGDDVISVYLIIRRYWGDRPTDPMVKMLGEMADRAATLAEKYVVPRVLRPISTAISSRS